MTIKQFTVCRLIIVILLAGLVANAINRGDYLLPIIALIAAMALMYYCKKKVKGVLADERDWQIWHKSMRISVFAFSLLAAVVSIVLVALGKNNPSLLPVGYTLSYSVCFILILNSILYSIFRKKGD